MSHSRRSAFAALSLLLLIYLVVYSLFPTPFLSIPRAHAVSRTIILLGYAQAWNATTNPNPSIIVTKGDSITMKLTSGDTIEHRFFVDVDGDGPVANCNIDKCSPFFLGSNTVSYPFTVDFAPGTYTYYCPIHPASMFGSFTVQAAPDFSLTAKPTSLTVIQGSSVTSTMNVTSLSGFSGTVNLSASASPTGPSPSLNPTSVTVAASSSMTSTLSVSTSSTTTTGTYIITVNATSGVTFHTVQVSVIVTLSFALNADFSGWNASKIANPAITQFRGVAFTAEVFWVNSIHDFAIYTAGFPAGSVSTSNTCSLSNTNGCLAASAFISSTGTVSLAFTPTIPADDFTGPGTYEYYCQIHPSSMHGKITIFKNPDLAKQGSVNIVDLATIAFSFGATPTSTNWNVVADLNNDGLITIVDLAICATYYGRPI